MASALVLTLAGCGLPRVDSQLPPPSLAPSSTSLPVSAPPTAAPTDEHLERVTISLDSRPQPPGFVVEDGIFDAETGPVSLEKTPFDALAGSLVASVVPSNDGRVLYYTTLEDRRDLTQLSIGEIGGVPTLRMVTLSTGRDELLRAGAYAPVVAPEVFAPMLHVTHPNHTPAHCQWLRHHTCTTRAARMHPAHYR